MRNSDKFVYKRFNRCGDAYIFELAASGESAVDNEVKN